MKIMISNSNNLRQFCGKCDCWKILITKCLVGEFSEGNSRTAGKKLEFCMLTC